MTRLSTLGRCSGLGPALGISLLASLTTAEAHPRRNDSSDVCWRVPRQLAREALAPGDGWASVEPGTSGGALAAPEQISVVHNRAELLAALNDGVLPVPPPAGTPAPPPSAVPKIIYVDGTLDFNVDDANAPLSCQDYYQNGYTPEAFAAAYDPVVWGRGNPTGPLEEARAASRLVQQSRIRIRVGSNTTIVGLGAHARLRGAWLDI